MSARTALASTLMPEVGVVAVHACDVGSAAVQ
jgi:hypothetical protein